MAAYFHGFAFKDNEKGITTLLFGREEKKKLMIYKLNFFWMPSTTGVQEIK